MKSKNQMQEREIRVYRLAVAYNVLACVELVLKITLLIIANI